jgi:plastocyanin
MKKAVPVVIILVVIIAVAGVWYSKSKKTNNTTMGNMASQSQNSSNTPQATDKVSIANFAFSPSSITVKKGTTVTWTNNDSAPHTVTENDSLTGPGSQTLNNGESYSFTFTATGTYHYHCSIHSSMTGSVTVTE